MKHFDLNIDKILENWEVFHAIRELIANAIDEHILTNTEKPQIFRDDAGWWHIRDFGRGLRYQDLIQTENPEKLGHPHLIGKFGIGLKDALATFDRRGIRVLIRSAHGDISLARVSKHSFDELVTLHATVADPSAPAIVGTDCCLYGISDSDIEAAKGLFLSFSAVLPLEDTRFGSVLSQGDGAAHIYINGMKVAEESNFIFSYNITSLNATIKKALNRERQNLGRSAYSDRVRSILLACQSEAVAQALSEDLQRHPSGEAHDELSWLDVQEHAVRILSSKSKVLFIGSSDIIQRPDIVDMARASGFQVLTVPENLAEKIDGMTDLQGRPVTAVAEFIRQHNQSFQFRWILPAQLSASELGVWQHTERILGYIGGRPRIVRDIRISETMSSGTFSTSETLGLWDPQNGWIILKRSLLHSLTAYAGILLHEALHAKYALSDVSRDFEHYLTELCGSLVAQIIDANNETLNPVATCASESPEAQRLARERPRYWEFLFTAELLKTKLAEVRGQFERQKMGVAHLPLRCISGAEFHSWVAVKIKDLVSLADGLATQLGVVQASWGPPGQPGDVQKIQQSVNDFVHLCGHLVEWEKDVQATTPPEEIQRLKNTMRGWAEGFLQEMERLPDELLRPFEGGAQPKAKVRIALTLKSPSFDDFYAELEALKKRSSFPIP
jgi:hypothetical protein